MSARDIDSAIAGAMLAAWKDGQAVISGADIRAALHAAGYVVAPREATAEMVAAYDAHCWDEQMSEWCCMSAQSCYRAMIAAAQESPDEG